MIKRYSIILITFLAIDMIWLVFVAPDFYQQQIGFIMAENVNFMPAIIFYLIYALVLLVFVVNVAVRQRSLIHALTFGAFLGFAMYATYDLTNLATLKDWPIMVTVVDLVWGSFVTALTSVVSFIVIQHFNIK